MKQETPYIIRPFMVPDTGGLRASAFLAEGTDEERQSFLQGLKLGQEYRVFIEPVKRSRAERTDLPVL